MNRLVKCIKFQLKAMAIGTLVFTAIYFGVCILLVATLSISISGSNDNSSFNSGFYIGSAIFAMVFVMSNYRSNFNYLMIFGNSRKNIFFSSVITSFIMSAALSFISVLTQWLEGIYSQGFGFKSSGGMLGLIYGDTNIASEFLFYMMLFVLISSFAMLYGSLSYKLGKAFITVFWVAFGLIWVILPVSTSFSSPFARFISSALTAFFSLGSADGILLAPVNFIITAILLAAITYLISSRQPQTA